MSTDANPPSGDAGSSKPAGEGIPEGFDWFDPKEFEAELAREAAAKAAAAAPIPPVVPAQEEIPEGFSWFNPNEVEVPVTPAATASTPAKPTSTTPAASSVPVPPASDLVSRLAVVIVGLCVIGGGGSLGWMIGSRLFAPSKPAEAHADHSATDSHSRDHGSPDPTKGAATAPKEPPLTSLRAADLRQIDALIAEGRYQAAVDLCRQDGGEANLPAKFRYRLALALEGLGQATEAVTHYRLCISRTADPFLTAASQLGLGRAALRAGQTEEPMSLFCLLLCRAADPILRTRSYSADAGNLLALAQTLVVLPPSKPDATRIDALIHAPPAWPVERYLRWAEPPEGFSAKKEADESEKPARPFVLDRKGAKEPADYRLSIRFERTELTGFLDWLAEQTGMTLAWGPDARDAVIGRRLSLECENIPLGDLLHWLTLPHGLAYEIDKGTIRLRTLASLPAAARRQYQLRNAQRSLRNQLENEADHPQIGDLYLALGNLEAAASNRSDATGWLERLAREQPRSSALTAGYYNLGLLRLQVGERATGRQAFLRCIDQAPGSQEAALSYWWAGRTHLDEKELTPALRYLERARLSDAGANVVGAAALGLAILQLLENQPRLCWEVIRDHRQVLRQAPFSAAAAFLDATARYRLVAGDPLKLQGVTAELVALLSEPRDDDWLGPAYGYLQGLALYQLGLNEEMVTLYDRITQRLKGPLADEMAARAADALAVLGRPKTARPRLEAIAAGSTVWASSARLRLADLDIREGQPDRALEHCRLLLQKGDLPRNEVLSMMSRAYTAKGDFARAADCLAGQVPST